MPKRRERGTELYLGGANRQRARPRHQHRRLAARKRQAEGGGKPGTDTVADIRPGSELARTYEERQRKPDDLEAQEGQRMVAVHALENLGTTDTGIAMLRHMLREQIQRVERGLDPINVVRDPDANRRIPTGAWNTILTPAEAARHDSDDL